jgi:hypothetical protein
LSDIGRLPDNLEELVNGTVTDVPNVIYSDWGGRISCTISLEGGWKGPYLTKKYLYDGFGNDMIFEKRTTGNDILQFGSYGEDNKKDITDDPVEAGNAAWQNKDMLRIVRQSQIFSAVTVRIFVRDTTSNNEWIPTDDSFTDEIHVILFSPYLQSDNEAVIRQIKANYINSSWIFSDSVTDTEMPQIIATGTSSEVTIRNLVPGIRKILVYGQKNGNSNASQSGVQTIELFPRENIVTVYLNQPVSMVTGGSGEENDGNSE